MVIFNRKVVDQQPLDFSVHSEGGSTEEDEAGGSDISGMKRVIDLHLNPEHHRLLNFSHHQNGGLVSSNRDRVPGDGGKMSRLRSESPPSSRASISPPQHRLSHHHHHHSHHNHHSHRNSSGSNDSRSVNNTGSNNSNSVSSNNSSTNNTNALNAMSNIPNSLIPLIPNPAMLLHRLVMPVAPGSPPGSDSPRHNDSSDDEETPKDFRGW